MTEPVEDSTELSERNKEADDVTQLSARVRGQLADDADEYTQLSARHLVADENTADATRLSKRSAGEAAKAPLRTSKLSALPPGSIGGAAAERGSFGTPAEEYVPRPLPADGPPEDGAMDGTAAKAERAAPLAADIGVQDPTQARARREAARHRRLITAAIIVGVTAAIMTAAIIGILALVFGQN